MRTPSKIRHPLRSRKAAPACAKQNGYCCARPLRRAFAHNLCASSLSNIAFVHLRLGIVVIGFGQLFLLAERQPDRPRPQGYINPGRNRIIAEPVGFATGNGEGSRRRIRTLIALQNPVAQVVVAILRGHGPFATPGQVGMLIGYARVSTQETREESQKTRLRARSVHGYPQSPDTVQSRSYGTVSTDQSWLNPFVQNTPHGSAFDMKLSGDRSLAGAFAEELPRLDRKMLQLYKIQQSATGWVDPAPSHAATRNSLLMD